jgi:hypothetical protein
MLSSYGGNILCSHTFAAFLGCPKLLPARRPRGKKGKDAQGHMHQHVQETKDLHNLDHAGRYVLFDDGWCDTFLCYYYYACV